ncbi:MAG: hypothetical protein LUD73_03375, partial [Lachnospiraceae bacterium]|nr:hypothetical protein [Lachnospiraceae bacterium]
LLIMHHAPDFKDYQWHWFLQNGYRLKEGSLQVKDVTYSAAEWLDFDRLWDTGRSRKGGLILYRAEAGGQA